MKKPVAHFFIQSTASFPDGAPQREEFDGDREFWKDCHKYGQEWVQEYDCKNLLCLNRDCPQHWPRFLCFRCGELKPLDKMFSYDTNDMTGKCKDCWSREPRNRI